MTKELFSVFDNKKKFFQVSEDELKKFYHYAHEGPRGFDYFEAKKLFDEVCSRQAQSDVRSWQIVCKYCPLYLRCEVPVEDTSKCQIFNKLTVRNYSVHAMEEIQFQRQRLMKIFYDMEKEGSCDNHCDICILCDNAGECIAEKGMRLLRESRIQDHQGNNPSGIILAT